MHVPIPNRPARSAIAWSHRLARLLVPLVLVAVWAVGPARAEVRIGVTPGALADSIHVAALEAKAEGLDVRVIEYDIAANPKRLRFVEIEGPQLVRAVADVDLAQGYPAHYVNTGRADFAGKALLYSGVDDRAYAIRFVARADRADTSEIRRFIALYQTSPAIRARIDATFAHNAVLYTLPWLH